MQSEDLPHKSGITTQSSGRADTCTFVGRLAPQIGDYDQGLIYYEANYNVGRLAPQIGDYDRTYHRPIASKLNMSEDLPHKSGITTQCSSASHTACQSEDLPHKSGITTSCNLQCVRVMKSEDLPHKSGITTYSVPRFCVHRLVGRLAPQIGDYDSLPHQYHQGFWSEDLPHKSGITTECLWSYACRCPSEDLPHKSGITTCVVCRAYGWTQVGRLAPQIGDYDGYGFGCMRTVIVGRLAPQIGDYDSY